MDRNVIVFTGENSNNSGYASIRLKIGYSAYVSLFHLYAVYLSFRCWNAFISDAIEPKCHQQISQMLLDSMIGFDRNSWAKFVVDRDFSRCKMDVQLFSVEDE